MRMSNFIRNLVIEFSFVSMLPVSAIVTTTVDDFAISGSAMPLTAVVEIARCNGDPLLFHSDCILHSA